MLSPFYSEKDEVLNHQILGVQYFFETNPTEQDI